MTYNGPRKDALRSVPVDTDQAPDGDAPGDSKADLEGRIIALRESGRSFAAIARQLGIPRAVDAQAAFVKAVRHQPEADRRTLVQSETGRLDDLEKRIRRDDGQDPERAQRRLVALEKLRRAMAATASA